jgi:VWFA-related protein
MSRFMNFLKRRVVMKLRKQILVPAAALAMLTFSAPATRPQEKAPAPVSIAVRVFDHDQFVKGLVREDFELLENGIPQKIEALDEVSKSAVSRHEGESLTPPVTTRRFYLLFQMYEYNPKVSEALRYFFTNALLPGDTLEIQTPMKSYRLTPQAFAQRPRDVLAKEMDNIVKKDINQGNFIYKNLIRDLRRFVSAIEGSNPIATGDEQSGEPPSNFKLEFLEYHLDQYRESLHKLEALRAIDQNKIIGFAQSLKKPEGRKLVFFVYQQEFRPVLSTREINTLVDTNQDNQDVLSALHDLFMVYHQNISFDLEKIVNAFCDSSADVNFLFMTRTPERFGGITMQEQSEDVFKMFSKVAAATGGISESTQNPAAEIKDALRASEEYYVLTYTPAQETKSDSFKTVTVKVRDKDYKVFSRKGYFTN